MKIERWAGVWGPESHKRLAKGFTTYPAFNEEPLQVFEEVSDMARAPMSLPSLTCLIPVFTCLLLDYMFITSQTLGSVLGKIQRGSDMDPTPQGLIGMYELSLLHEKELQGREWSEPRKESWQK